MARGNFNDGESAYELDSQFDEDEQDYQSESEAYSEEEQERQPQRSSRRGSVYSNASTVADNNSDYLQAAENAMGTLQTLHSSSSSNWNRALKHRSGVVVYMSKEKSYAGGAKKGGGGKGGHYAHVFKGEHDIKGFGPAAVFVVVGTRKLWDDWYNEGNLVENLNDTTSLTYMSMKGVVGTSTRDLSLVERVAGNATGTILFVSTSVVTPKVPRVSGRVRASIALNGWVLEPINGGTRVTYYLHVNVKTFIPAFAAVKYLARRPTCIARIDEYLQSNGSPTPMGDSSASERTLSNGNGNGSTRRRKDSTVSKLSRAESVATQSSGRTAAGPTGSLPVHVGPITDANTYPEIQKAQKLFKSLLSSYPSNEWTNATDAKNAKIWLNRRGGDVLPIVLGESLVEGATTEMVLGTILSEAARREWDSRFSSTEVISLDNGFDQGTHIECIKGVFPSLSAKHFTVVRAVQRQDTSTDNGTILLTSRSTRADGQAPKGSVKGQMDVVGWLLEDDGGSTKITMISQIDVKQQLAPFIYKILVSEMSLAPSAIASYIDDRGYAPFFVRWGEGPAQYLGDGDSDLATGKSVFKIDGAGEGTMQDGQQKCWLQYSDKMYERGVDITIKPASAATISRVAGMARTIQFTWSSDVRDGATITMKRARHGNGADDVHLDGEYVDVVSSMAANSGGGGAGMRKKPAAKKVAAPAPAFKSMPKTPAPESDEESIQVPVQVRSSKPEPISIPRSAPAPVAAPYVAPVAAPVAQAQVESGTRRIPEDACLILSPDLYFTRSQCAFILVLAFFAFLYGKLF